MPFKDYLFVLFLVNAKTAIELPSMVKTVNPDLSPVLGEFVFEVVVVV